MAALSVPLAFVRISFLSMLAYRLRFYTGIVTYLIYIAIYTSIWQAVHANPSSRDGLQEFGDFQTLFTYIAIGWLARSFAFNNIDRDLSDLVESGHIAARVARPVSLHAQLVFASLGQTLFRMTCFSPLVLLAMIALFDLRPPASITAFLLFALSIGFAIVILAEVNFLIGLLAFRTKSVLGIIRAKQYLLELLSGLLIPLSYFPDWLRWIAKATPFPTLTSIPNRLYLGITTGSEAAFALGQSAVWTLVLIVAAHAAGNAASKSLTIQGG